MRRRQGPMWVSAPTGGYIPRRTRQRGTISSTAAAGSEAKALAMSTLKSAPTPQMRHKRRITANVQRSRMKPGKFLPNTS